MWFSWCQEKLKFPFVTSGAYLKSAAAQREGITMARSIRSRLIAARLVGCQDRILRLLPTWIPASARRIFFGVWFNTRGVYGLHHHHCSHSHRSFGPAKKGITSQPTIFSLLCLGVLFNKICQRESRSNLSFCSFPLGRKMHGKDTPSVDYPTE